MASVRHDFLFVFSLFHQDPELPEEAFLDSGPAAKILLASKTGILHTGSPWRNEVCRAESTMLLGMMLHITSSVRSRDGEI